MWGIVSVALLGIIGIIMGSWIHELTHYLLSRAFGGNPEIFYRWGLPGAVSLDEPNLSDRGLRITGGITIIYPSFLLFVYLPVFGFPPLNVDNFRPGVYVHFASFFVLVASSGFSPSDCLALLSPSEFRRYANNKKEKLSHTQALRHIWYVFN
jgi:hypothetical protein